jgi:hypothetical protein
VNCEYQFKKSRFITVMDAAISRYNEKHKAVILDPDIMNIVKKWPFCRGPAPQFQGPHMVYDLDIEIPDDSHLGRLGVISLAAWVNEIDTTYIGDILCSEGYCETDIGFIFCNRCDELVLCWYYDWPYNLVHRTRLCACDYI